MLLDRDEGVALANDLWDAETRTVRVDAARGETVGIQVLVRGAPGTLSAAFTDLPADVDARWFVAWPVPTPHGRVGDPLVPWPSAKILEDVLPREQRPPHVGLFADIAIGRKATVGERAARIRLSAGRFELELRVAIRVHVLWFVARVQQPGNAEVADQRLTLFIEKDVRRF